jgi:regulator of nucleoside diphosphate kinase
MLLCKRIIPERDKQRLIDAANRARTSWVTYAPYLDHFRAELRRSEGVAPEHVPEDMITLNSRFELTDSHTGQTSARTLVYPLERMSQDDVSALSPAGVALFGARVGDEVCWLTADGPETATIRRLIYQPEAAGDLHL